MKFISMEIENPNIRDYFLLNLDRREKETANFRNRLEKKEIKILGRYQRFLKPVGYLDSIEYYFDRKRKIRHAITEKVLFEKQNLINQFQYLGAKNFFPQERAAI